MLYFVFFTIGIALIFDFLNGFHDAANSVATVVTTRVLSPLAAVAWAAFFNFVAAFVFGTGVAQTISSHLMTRTPSMSMWYSAGCSAQLRGTCSPWLALPTSSSHAIISGFASAAIAKAGFKALLLKGWVPVITFLVISPLIGFILAYIVMVAASWLSYKAPRHKVESVFRRLQLFSAGAYSLGHGTNDAQKTMGIIVALLLAAGKKERASGGFALLGRKQEIAWWIILSWYAAMALGTMAGGWRIVKTMASRITSHLRPIGGFSAEIAAATTIGLATLVKVPISTTHAIGGAVSGVGAVRGWHYVRWIWGKKIVWAWVLTFPGAGLVGAGSFLLLRLLLQPFCGTVQVK